MSVNSTKSSFTWSFKCNGTRNCRFGIVPENCLGNLKAGDLPDTVLSYRKATGKFNHGNTETKTVFEVGVGDVIKFTFNVTNKTLEMQKVKSLRNFAGIILKK